MKEEIINDIKFKTMCKRLGLDANKSEIINLNNDYVILNHVPNSNIYILIDKYYNIFNVEDFNNLDSGEIAKKVLLIYNYYSTTPDKVTSLFSFPYPFQNFTLKNIIDLGSKVNIMNLYLNINLITDNETKINYQRELRLLSYLKFLSLEINNYFIYTYKMKLLNLDVPNVYLYVMSLINKINNSFNDIISNLGEDINNNRLSYLAYDIKELLEDEKKNNSNDLDILANSLLQKDTNKSLKKGTKLA